MLEARQLTKRFNGRPAVNALDLRVDAGEVVCLLGANGAGKTTTVNLFMGFLAPDGGDVRVDDRAVQDDLAAARKTIGYVPEQVTLYPLLTGAENLRFFADIAGRRPTLFEARNLLAQAGLASEDADKPLRGYSKGMRQKVGVAIALAKGAKALIMDEPLSGLDPLAASDFGRQIAAIRDGGAAVLMVTHDIFRAREIADRIGIMNHGRLVRMLKADDVTAPDLDRLYADLVR